MTPLPPAAPKPTLGVGGFVLVHAIGWPAIVLAVAFHVRF